MTKCLHHSWPTSPLGVSKRFVYWVGLEGVKLSWGGGLTGSGLVEGRKSSLLWRQFSVKHLSLLEGNKDIPLIPKDKPWGMS